MERKLSKRQLNKLLDKVVREYAEVHGLETEEGVFKPTVAVVLNGCLCYRGPRTQPVCRNMRKSDCERVDFELKQINASYYAVPLLNPCE
ncbi:hypothetical protein ACU8M5_08915 [Rhizobium leguminosarum]